jgi:hypothetical protein
LRDLLVEKGPIRHNDSEFPKDRNSRHFFTRYYTRTLPNREKHDRKWLVYSNELDSVFCFCCKLFNSESCTNQLANQRTNDWRNLSGKIKRHETSSEHITNMNTWSYLQIRLLKNKTIDKNVQELINKEKDRWKNVLQRIIAIIKTLGKNNLPFRGTKEKIYQKNNGIFLSLIVLGIYHVIL